MKKNKIINTLLLLTILCLTSMSEQTAVNFKLPDLSNKQTSLDDLLQKGPVLLDFWATWCKPCLKAFPKLNELHKKYSARGFTVVGLNQDGPRNQAKIKPFVASMNIEFPILIDANNQVMRQFSVQNLPTAVLISPDGRIVGRYVGYNSGKVKELETQIENLIREYSSSDEEQEKAAQ
jgi:peroxiredoxin